jgi:6,7-dimethyl-8-ribityllumazine synthase
VRTYEGAPEGRGRRIGIVAARFNDVVTKKLLEGCVDTLRAAGVAGDDVDVAWVPGAFEVPLVARRLAESGSYDAVICLGAVIRGETAHFDYVCRSVTDGLTRVALDESTPVAHGVLTVDTEAQARDRAGFDDSPEDKGWSSVVAALDAAVTLRKLK